MFILGVQSDNKKLLGLSNDGISSKLMTKVDWQRIWGNTIWSTGGRGDEYQHF
jgi:hypothetical protein